MAPSRLPLTIVCGAPGSGKSTWVREHASGGDIVIDLDEIRCKMSCCLLHRAEPEWTAPALDERNRLLRALALASGPGRAWFIIGAPTGEEREWWATQLGAERVVVMPTSRNECLRRIARDPARRGLEEDMGKWVDKWFEIACASDQEQLWNEHK